MIWCEGIMIYYWLVSEFVKDVMVMFYKYFCVGDDYLVVKCLEILEVD